jgi:hypothetical protein
VTFHENCKMQKVNTCSFPPLVASYSLGQTRKNIAFQFNNVILDPDSIQSCMCMIPSWAPSRNSVLTMKQFFLAYQTGVSVSFTNAENLSGIGGAR